MPVSEFVELLGRHAMFAALDGPSLHALARRLAWLCVPGGQPVYLAGEAADALYLLKSGSLGVFEGSHTGERRRLVTAGEWIGAIGLLDGGVRDRDVRALRDCELLRLDRAVFEALVRAHPGVLAGLARLAIGRLRQREHAREPAGTPRTFAVLPVRPDLPVRTLAMQLARALETHGRCVVVDAALGRSRDGQWFAACESRHRFVLYLDEGGDPAWRGRCLRQADAVVEVAAGHARDAGQAWPSALPASDPRPRHLALLHPGHQVPLGAAAAWRARVGAGVRLHHVCGGADVARLARLASGHGRGLALAGGGARGLAHLGAWMALHEAGHTFDAVGGTSIGAIIGAGIAAGWNPDEAIERCVGAFLKGRPLSDWTLPLVALTRGRRAERMLRSTFGALAIEDLALPFFCVATSLSGDGMVVARDGPLWLWLRASSAIPGVLPPLLHHGRVYIDGAPVNNLPVDVLAVDGLAHITALDVRAEIVLQADVDEAATPPWWRLLWQHRRAVQRPGLVSTLVRAGMVGGDAASVARRERADLLLTPPLDHIGMLDWRDWRRAIDAGYRHATEALEARERGCGATGPATMGR